jgi:hypothetical protein
MMPVDQEYFYCEEPRQYGDCTRAVIAALLDLSIAEVPHFLQDAKGDAYEYYQAIDAFLEQRGLEILWDVNLIYYWRPGDPDFYHYMSGPSPRNASIGHAVVGLNGQIIHDPHPDRTGLAGSEERWKIAVLRPIKDMK